MHTGACVHPWLHICRDITEINIYSLIKITINTLVRNTYLKFQHVQINKRGCTQTYIHTYIHAPVRMHNVRNRQSLNTHRCMHAYRCANAYLLVRVRVLQYIYTSIPIHTHQCERVRDHAPACKPLQSGAWEDRPVWTDPAICGLCCTHLIPTGEGSTHLACPFFL